jgi:hypothetical protein
VSFANTKKILFFLTLSFVCQAITPNSSYALSRKRLHPSNVCGSMLSLLRTYATDPQYLKEERDVAVDFLRGFRLNQLGFQTVDPSSTLVSLSSKDNPSKKEIESLAMRIRGIEINSRAEGASIDQRVWTVVKKYKGTKEIKDYILETNEAVDAVTNLTEQTKNPWYDVTIRKRLLQAVLFTVNASFSPFWCHVGLHQIAAAFTLLGFHSEPMALLSYLQKEDGFFKENQKQIESFLKGQEGWSYTTHRYSVHREVIHGALGVGSSDRKFGEGLNSQAYHDTRGLWTKVVLQYPALIKTAAQSPGSLSDKFEVFQTARDQWAPLYVSYDRLLSMDPQSGEPVLVVAIRTSLERDPAKQFAKEKVTVPGAQLAPVKVPGGS